MINIAIVGRPNVGKSALFNRLLNKRIAIVAPASGITRDRIYGRMEWDGCRFNVIDTGGVDFDSHSILQKQILEQIKISIEEAHLIIFVTDIMNGITNLDQEVSRLLRKSSKKVIIAVNKADNDELLSEMDVFYGLGWDKIVPVSAVHGLGINDLLDMIIKEIPQIEHNEGDIEPEQCIRVAVIGKPNAGKSTFVNAVLDKPRMIVDEEAGTTRDAVDSKVVLRGKHWLFIDTGGMRKSKKLKESSEFYSIKRAYTAIDQCDVVILIIDGWEGVVKQDAKLLDYITKQGKGCVLAVNKWDLVREVTERDYIKRIYERLPKHTYIPSVFISALKHKNIERLLQTVENISDSLSKKVPTSILNKILQKTDKSKIYYGTQVSTKPPEFLLFVRNPKEINGSQIGFLTNQLRNFIGFSGVPIRWKIRRRKSKYGKI